MFYNVETIISLAQFKQALNQKASNINKLLNIVKLILVLITFGFVFYKLIYAYHIHSLYTQFSFDFSLTNSSYFIIAFFLAGINWLTESYKWKLLVSKNEPMTLSESAKGVLSGVALGMITPNQLGNFVGRVIHLKELSKLSGSLVSVIGNTAQVIMTLAFGILATIWFMQDQMVINSTIQWVLIILLIILLILAIFSFLNIHWVSAIARKAKWNKYLQVFTGYSKTELTLVLIYSFIRYLIFVIQYMLMVKFYHIDLNLQTSFMCICGSLFIQAFVPSFLLLDIGMRGASALWLFGYYTQQATAILLMTYSIWIINLLLPGMIGLYCIVKWRINK